MARPSLVQHGIHLVRHVIPAVVKPIHSLWHQIIGFLFLVLAAWAGLAGIRTFRELDSGKGSLFRLIVIAGFVAIMTGYGISSFFRARKISRS